MAQPTDVFALVGEEELFRSNGAVKTLLSVSFKDFYRCRWTRQAGVHIPFSLAPTGSNKQSRYVVILKTKISSNKICQNTTHHSID